MKQAVFIDKDGTLIEDVPFNVRPELIRLMPGAEEALSLLHRSGYRLFIVSNQSGVAHGYFDIHALDAVSDHLRSRFTRIGVPIDGFYYCPHHPQGTVPGFAAGCACRKPRPGMLQRAAREHAIDLSRSWMVGDILHDIEAGHGAGCRAILIENGNETEWDLSRNRIPDYMAPDLWSAAQEIVGDHWENNEKQWNQPEASL